MFLDSACLQITLLSVAGKTVRPALILRHVFSVAEDHIKQAKVVKNVQTTHHQCNRT
jgi:hypothetical protein